MFDVKVKNLCLIININPKLAQIAPIEKHKVPKLRAKF